MENLKEISRQQQPGLVAISQPLKKHLGEEDLEILELLMKQMILRYPHQDLTPAMESLVQDFETLALKYGLQQVQNALADLRIRPGQNFFPQPSEVAEVCEVAAARARSERTKAAALAEAERSERESRHRAEHPEEYVSMADVMRDVAERKKTKLLSVPDSEKKAPKPAICPACMGRMLDALSPADLRLLANVKEEKAKTIGA